MMDMRSEKTFECIGLTWKYKNKFESEKERKSLVVDRKVKDRKSALWLACSPELRGNTVRG